MIGHFSSEVQFHSSPHIKSDLMGHRRFGGFFLITGQLCSDNLDGMVEIMMGYGHQSFVNTN